MSIDREPIQITASVDLEDLAEQLGYSVSGYGDLSYASRSSVRKADEIVEAVLAGQKRAT